MALAELRQQSMNDAERVAFKEEVARRRKSIAVGYILLWLLGWHYAYVGKWGVQFLFWLTGGGLLMWWLVDWFRVPSIVGAYNNDIADTVALQISAMRS